MDIKKVKEKLVKAYESISKYNRDSDSYLRGKADGLDLAIAIIEETE